MGYFKQRRPFLNPTETWAAVGSASSAGKTIGPRGSFSLFSTSTVADTPTIMYANAPSRIGDRLEVNCLLASSSAGLVLRSTSATMFMGASSAGYNSIQFFYAGSGAVLTAISTSAWAVLGATTAATAGLPLFATATS